jgi:hypothetical protein
MTTVLGSHATSNVDLPEPYVSQTQALPESLIFTLHLPASSFLHLTSHVAVEWSARGPATKDLWDCVAAPPMVSMLLLTPRILLIHRSGLEYLHIIERRWLGIVGGWHQE